MRSTIGRLILKQHGGYDVCAVCGIRVVRTTDGQSWTHADGFRLTPKTYDHEAEPERR